MADNTFTPARIADLRALAEKATKGPWFDNSNECGHLRIYGDGRLIADVGNAEGSRGAQWRDDCRLISGARTALPAALDEIERLCAENERLRAALAPFAIESTTMAARCGRPDGAIADEVLISIRLGACRRACRALEGGAV